MDKSHLNQSYYLRKFCDEYREDFNPDLFKRDNAEIVESVRQVLLSLEKDKYFTLKLIKFEAIYNYEEIYNILRSHEERRRRKNDKSENSFDFINIKDSDIILVKVQWYIRHNGLERQEIDGKTIEVMNPEQVLDVLIALPRFVKGYYFRLAGNYYSTSFQIVDGSTYNNNNSNSKVDTITLKTMFMPIRMFRSFKDMHDINSGNIKTIQYNTIIFNNVVNAMYYLLANYGMYGTARFLEIDCVNISLQPIKHPDFVCFEKNGIFISAPRIYFQDAVVQSFMTTIYDAIKKDTTINDLFDTRFWLINLGIAYKNSSIDKGLFVLDSVDGIYDNITKRDLHLSNEDKDNIYCLLRWMIREFKELKLKENVDVRTKRIRIADYISAVYANKINQSMHRILDMGKHITLAKVIQAIYTHPMYVINNVSAASMANLVSYRDLVNDGDSFSALKYTYKGISGLGEEGSVQDIYRHVDPSHLGILDLDSSSNSDPGMTGMLCPMTKIYNNSFSEYEEPNTWRGSFGEINKEFKANLTEPIKFTKEPIIEDYKNIRTSIEQHELELNKITCPIVSTIDPLIDFGAIKKNIASKYCNKEQEEKSLFTIISDDDPDSGFILNTNDDFYDDQDE